MAEIHKVGSPDISAQRHWILRWKRKKMNFHLLSGYLQFSFKSVGDASVDSCVLVRRPNPGLPLRLPLVGRPGRGYDRHFHRAGELIYDIDSVWTDMRIFYDHTVSVRSHITVSEREKVADYFSGGKKSHFKVVNLQAFHSHFGPMGCLFYRLLVWILLKFLKSEANLMA